MTSRKQPREVCHYTDSVVTSDRLLIGERRIKKITREGVVDMNWLVVISSIRLQDLETESTRGYQPRTITTATLHIRYWRRWPYSLLNNHSHEQVQRLPKREVAEEFIIIPWWLRIATTNIGIEFQDRGEQDAQKSLQDTVIALHDGLIQWRTWTASPSRIPPTSLSRFNFLVFRLIVKAQRSPRRWTNSMFRFSQQMSAS